MLSGHVPDRCHDMREFLVRSLIFLMFLSNAAAFAGTDRQPDRRRGRLVAGR